MRLKLGALLIAPLLVLSLASCGGEGGGGTDSLETAQPGSGYVEITDQQGSVDGFVGAADDATVERCESVADSWKGTGTVTNPTGETQSYRIYVAFNRNRDTRGLVQVDVASVAAGGTAEWQAEAPIGGDELKCVLRVERFAPQG